MRKVDHKNHRIYGDAQYQCALSKFNLTVGQLRNTNVSKDNIAIVAGTSNSHNRINFIPDSCVIALEKMWDSFDPLLDTLDACLCHVMSRLFAMSK